MSRAWHPLLPSSIKCWIWLDLAAQSGSIWLPGSIKGWKRIQCTLAIVSDVGRRMVVAGQHAKSESDPVRISSDACISSYDPRLHRFDKKIKVRR